MRKINLIPELDIAASWWCDLLADQMSEDEYWRIQILEVAIYNLLIHHCEAKEWNEACAARNGELGSDRRMFGTINGELGDTLRAACHMAGIEADVWKAAWPAHAAMHVSPGFVAIQIRPEKDEVPEEVQSVIADLGLPPETEVVAVKYKVLYQPAKMNN